MTWLSTLLWDTLAPFLLGQACPSMEELFWQHQKILLSGCLEIASIGLAWQSLDPMLEQGMSWRSSAPEEEEVAEITV